MFLCVAPVRKSHLICEVWQFESPLVLSETTDIKGTFAIDDRFGIATVREASVKSIVTRLPTPEL